MKEAEFKKNSMEGILMETFKEVLTKVVHYLGSHCLKRISILLLLVLIISIPPAYGMTSEYTQKWFLVWTGDTPVGFVNVKAAKFKKVKGINISGARYVTGDYFLVRLKNGKLVLYNALKSRIVQTILQDSAPEFWRRFSYNFKRRMWALYNTSKNKVVVYKFLRGKFRKIGEIKNFLRKGEGVDVSISGNFFVINYKTKRIHTIALRKPRYIHSNYSQIADSFALVWTDKGADLYNKFLTKVKSFGKDEVLELQNNLLLVDHKLVYDLSRGTKPKLILNSKGKVYLSHIYRDDTVYEVMENGRIIVYEYKKGKLLKIATFSNLPDDIRQGLSKNVGGSFAYLGNGIALMETNNEKILFDSNGKILDRGKIFAFVSYSGNVPVFYTKTRNYGYHFRQTIYKIENGQVTELFTLPRDFAIYWISRDRKVACVEDISTSTEFMAFIIGNDYKQFTESLKGDVRVYRYGGNEIYDFDIGDKDVIYNRNGNVIFDSRNFKIMTWREFDNLLHQVSSVCFYKGDCKKALKILYSTIERAERYGNFDWQERLLDDSAWLYKVFMKANQSSVGIRLYTFLNNYVKNNKYLLKRKTGKYFGVTYIKPLEEGFCALYGTRKSGKPTVDFSLAYPHCKKACKLGSDLACEVQKKLRNFFFSQGQIFEPKPVTTFWLTIITGLLNYVEVKDFSFSPSSGNPTFYARKVTHGGEIVFTSKDPFSGILTITVEKDHNEIKVFKVRIDVPSSQIGNTGYIDINFDSGYTEVYFKKLTQEQEEDNFLDFIKVQSKENTSESEASQPHVEPEKKSNSKHACATTTSSHIKTHLLKQQKKTSVNPTGCQNLLNNGDFKDGLTGWKVVNYTSGANVEVIEENDNKVVKLHHDGDNDWCSLSQEIASKLEKGKTYVFSYRYKTTSPVSIGIRFTDPETIWHSSALNNDYGWNHRLINDGNWHQDSFEFTVGDNHPKPDEPMFAIFLDYHNTGDVYIDDVIIAERTESCYITNVQNSLSLSNGLVAYYSFDNCDARDDSGNGNNGKIYGNPECVRGVVGKALRFHGIKSMGGYLNPDRVFVANSDKLRFDRYMSVSYWVRIEGDKVQTGADCSGDAVDGKGGIVLAKSGDRNGWYISTSENGVGIGFYPWLGGKGAGVSDLEESSYKNWRFEAFVVDSLTNDIKIFINGKLVASKKGDFDFSLPNQRDLYIGVSWNAYIPGIGGACLDYWYPLDGIIDEIRIYDRALTEDEIKALYEMGKPVE